MSKPKRNSKGQFVKTKKKAAPKKKRAAKKRR